MFKPERGPIINPESYKSHGPTPSVSSFDNTPTVNASTPVPTTSDTEASVFSEFSLLVGYVIKEILTLLVPTRGSGGERVRGRKSHSVAMMFLGHSDETHATRRFRGGKGADAGSAIPGGRPVEDTIEVNENDQSTKIERESEKIQAPVDQITVEPLVKMLGTSETISGESPQGDVGKLEPLLLYQNYT